MAYKLDMNQTLAAIDGHDFDFLSERSEDVRKDFVPYVVLRRISAMQGPYADLMLMMVNSRANINFFDLSSEPDLQYRLMASCGLGVGGRFEWIAPARRARSANALHGFLGPYFPQANDQELDILIGTMDRDAFETFVNGCGLTPKATKDALDLYDRYTGREKNNGRKKKSR